MKPNSAIELRDYDRLAEHARSSLELRLSELPMGCASIALRAYRGRRDRSQGVLSISELAPWILGDLIGASPAQLDPVAVAWLEMSLGILMLDDVLDGTVDSDRRAPHMIVSELLVQRGLTAFLPFVPPRRHPEITQILAVTAEAAIYEVDHHRGRTSSYSEPDLIRVRDKLAFLHACALAVLAISKNDTDSLRIKKLIDALSLGLQLLDDLTDLQEDWKVANLTMPLNKAVVTGFLRIGDGEVPRLVSSREIVSAVVRSGGFTETLQGARSVLSKASDEICTLRRTSTGFGRYLSRLNGELARLEAEVEEIRRSWGDRSCDRSKLICDPALDALQERLRKIAQGS
jgi:hypothetical protein